MGIVFLHLGVNCKCILLHWTDELHLKPWICILQFNWYTKRGSLAGLYKATEIYMLQDRSEDNIDTWAFLDRRLDSLQTFGKIVRNVSAMKTFEKTESLWQNSND